MGNRDMFVSAAFICIVWFGVAARGKECTNTPTELSSHTFRYQLLSSMNETWKKEVLSYYHLNDEEESTWMDMFPREILGTGSRGEFDWAMLYRGIKRYPVGTGVAPTDGFLKEVSLHDVRLDPDSMYGRAQQTNLEYLLMLDVDRLVWSFRHQSGLPTPGIPYGGWEAPNMEVRGHFVGHYMSAAAKMWASTHNDTLKEKMFAVINALDACQKKMGTGYLSAFPSEFFDRFEAIKPVWAPYYTVHKIMAGLLDQYLFSGNSQALKIVTWMADYFANRVKNVILKYSIERHWRSLNEETGGMNDVLYNLYRITGDKKHLVLAHLFDKPCFLGLLAIQEDSLSGFHANTHIPVVIGAQSRFEVTGDFLYKEIGAFFMDIVNSSHSYATGGTSVNEFWLDPNRLADTLKTENEESCTTYNMLKVSRNLFRWKKEMAYADYYERALINGVLGIQRGREPGVMIYMLPLGRGVSKVRSFHKWGTPFDSFWCCYGTGIESFSKLADSVYFEEKRNRPTLYIIQFISSSLDWKSGGIIVNQKIEPIFSWDPYLRVQFTFSLPKSEKQPHPSTLYIRIPFWTSLHGGNAVLNGRNLMLPFPGNFLVITREWTSKDKLTLQLPIELRTEAIKDDRPGYASIRAILFGPYLLAGLSSGDWDISIRNAESFSDWIRPIPRGDNSLLVSLTQEGTNGSLVFSNANDTLVMVQLPDSGTDSAVHATFKFIYMNGLHSESMTSAPILLYGEQLMLEPFDVPGAVVVHNGPGKDLAISYSASAGHSLFTLVAGLDGKPDSISLESESLKGCYISSCKDGPSSRCVQVGCLGVAQSADDDILFRKAASFTISKTMREYNSISFVARGVRRNFILEPLLSLRDESYTVYFNLTA